MIAWAVLQYFAIAFVQFGAAGHLQLYALYAHLSLNERSAGKSPDSFSNQVTTLGGTKPLIITAIVGMIPLIFFWGFNNHDIGSLPFCTY